MLQLQDLPKECFNQVCAYLTVPNVNLLGQVSKTFQSLVHSKDESNELWNLLLCQRLWTVDPSLKLEEETDVIRDWRWAFKELVRAEKDHQTHLDELRQLDLNGWLERHFIGNFSYQWRGWERRYWSWDGNCLFAWSDASRTHCYAQFPVSARSAVRRVSPEEQIELGKMMDGGRNPITSKPYVFTIENTSFDLLFACKSEEELQLWLDKISVTLHPLKYGQTYKAPAKYMLQKNNVQQRKRAKKERETTK